MEDKKIHSKTMKDLIEIFEPYLTTKDIIFILIQDRIIGLYCKILKFVKRIK